MELTIPDRREPPEAIECERDSIVCTDTCDKWKRDECMMSDHYWKKCWDECKYCEED